MSSSQNVYHLASIISINGDKGEVQIIQQSACGKCHAKSMCAMSDMKEKVIEVSFPAHQNFSVGQQVTVVLARKLGSKAVVLAYLLPFIFMMFALLLVFSITKNELAAGLSAIGILVPYYLILSLFNKHFKKEYEFRVIN